MSDTETRNPYAIPTANVDVPIESTGTQAILIGAAVGNGVANAVLSIATLVFFWILVAQGTPAQDTYSRAYGSSAYLVFAHSLSCVCMAVGGYWAARLGPQQPLRNALIAGVLTAVLELLQNFIPYEIPVPFWSRIASIVLPVPAFLLGAVWWNQSKQRSTHRSAAA